ncbi:MAG TPA: zinc-ribbon domain-containing protein [Anaerolineae bacterium]
MSMKCPNCGFDNPDGFSFCGRCGTRLDAAPPAPALTGREATINQLKDEGDAAKRQSDFAAALERYQQALALLDSVILASDATLHVQLIKSRFDILAERYPLWESAGRPDRIEPDLQEMLGLARRAGDGKRLGIALMTLAQYYVTEHRDEAARPLLEEAVSLTHSQSDRAGEAAALAQLAHMSWRAGRMDTVADAFQRAHELRRHVAEPAGLARSYFDLGLLYRDAMSHPFYAISHFEKSQELARQAGDTEIEARGLIAVAVCWTRLGDYTTAKAVLNQAQQKVTAIESAVQQAWLIVAQADVERETGSAQARATIERAVALAIDADLPELEWHALMGRARVDHALDTWDTAREPLDRMQALERDNGLHAYCAIWTQALLARTLLHAGQPKQAADVSQQAMNALQTHGFTGVPTPQTILWTHYEVLNHAKDQAAFHFLRQARELMLAQANTIGDGALRANFLRDVSINRAIGDDWSKRHS